MKFLIEQKFQTTAIQFINFSKDCKSTDKRLPTQYSSFANQRQNSQTNEEVPIGIFLRMTKITP
ncbi:hypothetical protein B0E43_04670 [Algoriphagus sp. A40]|nr:hypothetical protein B0E43_04670 [Algoriphagus sp. A40]